MKREKQSNPQAKFQGNKSTKNKRPSADEARAWPVKYH